jgi:hypothetical protein
MQTVPFIIYVLCFLTCIVCGFLLARTYHRTRVRLLLWSALCFCGLAVSNLFLLLDLIIFPDIDLLPIRAVATLAGLAVLLYGFVWES